ncbi:MAG TPA: hypothetical protein VE133_03680 [Candidatus Sulfotelmatobacter sp.]|nr:hypothetical protein [Candidatus Sulfotelmatobacter sp.]
MKNWYLPVTVLGLSGLGLLFASERGRQRIRQAFDKLVQHGDPLGEFNKFCEEQLNMIQRNLDRLAEALEDPQPS